METVEVEARLAVEGEEVAYYADGGAEVWRLAVVKILMVAEYTSTEGSLDEDYFLQFGTVRDGEALFTGCVVPAGAEEVLEELALRVGGSMRLKLFDSVGFASRVVWPEEWVGQALFVVKDDDAAAKARWVFWGKKPQWVVSPKLVAWMLSRGAASRAGRR